MIPNIGKPKRRQNGKAERFDWKEIPPTIGSGEGSIRLSEASNVALPVRLWS